MTGDGSLPVTITVDKLKGGKKVGAMALLFSRTFRPFDEILLFDVNKS